MVKPDIKKKSHQPKPIITAEEELKEANRVKSLIAKDHPVVAMTIEEACDKVVFYDQKVKEFEKEYEEKLAKANKAIDLLVKIKEGYEYLLSIQPLYVGMTKEEFKEDIANFIQNHDYMREESNKFYINMAMELDKILKAYFLQDKPKVEQFHENAAKLNAESIIMFIADQQACKEKLLHDIHDLYFQGRDEKSPMISKEEFKKAIFEQIKLNRGDVNIELESKYKELKKAMEEQKNFPKDRIANVVELLKTLDTTITDKDREEAAKRPIQNAIEYNGDLLDGPIIEPIEEVKALVISNEEPILDLSTGC
jgi:hypothetical protein